MNKKQVVICFDDGTWTSDTVSVDKDQTDQEAIGAYMAQYEQVKGSMGIVAQLLPSIIHISIMGE
jgi:hypothetical protein